MADNWARTIFGTSARPRYGSTWSIVALVLIVPERCEVPGHLLVIRGHSRLA